MLSLKTGCYMQVSSVFCGLDILGSEAIGKEMSQIKERPIQLWYFYCVYQSKMLCCCLLRLIHTSFLLVHFKAGPMEKKDKESYTKLLIFWLERIQKIEPGKRISFILDTSGSGLGNSDMGFVKFIIHCFTSYFPCMLGMSFNNQKKT